MRSEATPALAFGVLQSRDYALEEMKSCTAFLKTYYITEKGLLPRPGKPVFESPWLTPILGTGCAPEQVDSTNLVHVICGLCKAVAGMEDVSGVLSKDNVTDFALDLVSERLGKKGSEFKVEVDFCMSPSENPSPQRGGGSKGETHVSPQTISVFILALRLTHLFLKLKVRTRPAPRRIGYDDSVSLDHTLIDWVWLKKNYVDPSIDTLKSINTDGNLVEITNLLTKKLLPYTIEENKEEMLASFISRIKERLGMRIKRSMRSLQTVEDSYPLYWSDVQWWAELAWLMIAVHAMRTNRISAYPGWAGLLLELCCYAEIEEDTYPLIAGRPVFSGLVDGYDVIKSKCCSDILNRSCQMNETETSVHDAVAELLIEQTSFRVVYPKTRLEGKKGEPPIASAFVTSFDLDLEIALLRKLKQDEKILITFPVYLSNEYNYIAHTCWLALEVRKINGLSNEKEQADQLKLLVEPDLKDFSLLAFAGLKEKECPIVVRLVGCPLIKLPIIDRNVIDWENVPRRQGRAMRDDDPNKFLIHMKALFHDVFSVESHKPNEKGLRPDEALRSIYNTLRLEHAVIVTERSATLHGFIDLLQTGSNVGAERPDGPGLSSDVASDGKGWRRFWSLLGVQIGEIAIRQRVETLLSVLPLDVGSSQDDKLTGERSSQDDKPNNERIHPQNGQIRGVAINRREFTSLEADFLAWNRLIIIKDNVDKFFELTKRQIENLDRVRKDLER